MPSRQCNRSQNLGGGVAKPLKCPVLLVPPSLTPWDTAPCQEPHCRQDPASSQPAAAVTFPAQPHHSKIQSHMPGEASRNHLPWTQSLSTCAGHKVLGLPKSLKCWHKTGSLQTVLAQRAVVSTCHKGLKMPPGHQTEFSPLCL